MTAGVEPEDPTAMQVGESEPAVHPTAKSVLTPAGTEPDTHDVVGEPLRRAAPLSPAPTAQQIWAVHETELSEVTSWGTP
jgi:hypothetical protein